MRILDINGYAADVFYVLLLCSGQYDFLPELYEVLGKDLTLRVLDIFAGNKIKFPPVRELHRLAAEVHIYIRVKNATSKNRAQVIHDLSREYHLSTENVRLVYEKTKKLIEGELGMQVLHERRRRYRSDT